MAPSVRFHLPLFTTRIQFQLDNLPPLSDITVRADFTGKIRQNRHPLRHLPDITLRADLTERFGETDTQSNRRTKERRVVPPSRDRDQLERLQRHYMTRSARPVRNRH